MRFRTTRKKLFSIIQAFFSVVSYAPRDLLTNNYQTFIIITRRGVTRGLVQLAVKHLLSYLSCCKWYNSLLVLLKESSSDAQFVFQFPSLRWKERESNHVASFFKSRKWSRDHWSAILFTSISLAVVNSCTSYNWYDFHKFKQILVRTSSSEMSTFYLKKS